MKKIVVYNHREDNQNWDIHVRDKIGIRVFGSVTSL